MQLTGELAPLGYAHRQTEFIVAPVGPDAGKLIYGACGPTALGSAASAALQKLVSTGDAYAVMEPRGLCDASGVTTDGKIATASAALGLTIAEHHPYGASDVWNGWQTFLGWHLGSCDHPTVIELAHGQNLRDEISGQGENASGLTYHFICLIKRHAGGYSQYAGKTLPSGYWACDGDNYAGGNSRANGFSAADVMQFYSDATLAASVPCAGIAFNRATTVQSGGGTVGVPAGWTDDGVTLKAPNGVPVKGEIRGFVLANAWGTEDTPEAPESYPSHVELGNPSLGTGAVQFFKYSGQLTAVPVDAANPNGAWRAFRTWNGQEMVALHAALDAADAATKSAQDAANTAQQQLTAAQAQIAQLQAQLAALQNQPPVPTPAPLTPQQEKAIAAIAALQAALA